MDKIYYKNIKNIKKTQNKLIKDSLLPLINFCSHYKMLFKK